MILRHLHAKTNGIKVSAEDILSARNVGKPFGDWTQPQTLLGNMGAQECYQGGAGAKGHGQRGARTNRVWGGAPSGGQGVRG